MRPDDPRLLLSRAFRAVHFVFGLRWPEVRPLPGSALVTALGTLGMSSVAARGALLRLRRAGALTSRRVGRRSNYEVTPASARLMEEVVRRSLLAPPPWDGVFRVALVAVPAHARAYRETFNRRAAYAGFGTLRPGLLIAPYEASWAAVEPLVAAAGDTSWITRAELRLSPADACQMASEVWDLGALARTLRSESRRMSSAAVAFRAKPRPGPAAMLALWRAVAPFYLVFSVQPPLPIELLPREWPLSDAQRAFQDVATTIAPVALAYLSSLIEAGNLRSGRSLHTSTARPETA